MNNNINDFPSIVDDMRRPRDSVAGYAVCMGLCELNGATAMGYSGAVNFTLHSSGATAVELLLFDRGKQEPYAVIPFPDRYRIGDVWTMIVFGLGPAGTGKTYLAMAMAITAFKGECGAYSEREWKSLKQAIRRHVLDDRKKFAT